jgi:hypothetical protein
MYAKAISLAALAMLSSLVFATGPAMAQQKRPLAGLRRLCGRWRGAGASDAEC